jgi:TPR repeat protein
MIVMRFLPLASKGLSALLAVFALSLLLAGCTAKPDGETAKPVSQKQKIPIMQALLSEAQQGNRSAQYHLANMYRSGQFGTKSAAEAVKWYREAAEQEHAASQHFLGVMYARGEGVAEDLAQAAYWHHKAAEQGNVASQYVLGVMYANGHGVARSTANSAKWFEAAAEQGHADAQQLLGSIYMLGLAGPPDLVKAYKWLRLSAAQGNTVAASAIKTVRIRMNSDEFAEAEKRAQEWMVKHRKK